MQVGFEFIDKAKQQNKKCPEISIPGHFPN